MMVVLAVGCSKKQDEGSNEVTSEMTSIDESSTQVQTTEVEEPVTEEAIIETTTEEPATQSVVIQDVTPTQAAAAASTYSGKVNTNSGDATIVLTSDPSSYSITFTITNNSSETASFWQSQQLLVSEAGASSSIDFFSNPTTGSISIASGAYAAVTYYLTADQYTSLKTIQGKVVFTGFTGLNDNSYEINVK